MKSGRVFFRICAVSLFCLVSGCIGEVNPISSNKMVELANAEREKRGIAPLRSDSDVTAAAKDRAQEYASGGYVTPLKDFLRKYSLYSNDRAEISVRSLFSKDEEEYIKDWMSSKRRNHILNSLATRSGAGIYKDPEDDWIYCVMLFLGPDNRFGTSALFFLGSAPLAFEPVSLNQRSVLDSLYSLEGGSALYDDLLSLAAADQSAGLLDALSGELHSSLQSNLQALDQGFMRDFMRRAGQNSLGNRAGHSSALAAGDEAPSWRKGLWLNVGGGRLDLDGSGGTADSRLDGPELSGGFDCDLPDGWLAGIGLGYSDKEMKINDRRSRADIDSFSVALYGGKELPVGPGTARALLGGAYTYHDISSTRAVAIGAGGQTLGADYDADAWQFFLEGAYTAPVTEGVFLEPFASLNAGWLHIGGFREKGGNAALAANSTHENSLVSLAGLRLLLSLPAWLSLSAELGWLHAYGDLAPERSLAFSEGGAPFSIRGNALNRDALDASLSAEFALNANARLGLAYSGVWGNKAVSNGGTLFFRIEW